jgi:D-sedoheptulose 7-phosphate isomerase
MIKKINSKNNILLESYIKLYLSERSKIHKVFPISDVVKILKRIIYTYKNDGYLYVAGNGGGSSAAEGFATDIRTHPFVSSDKTKTTTVRRLKVYCCTESSGLLTGISNDLGNDYVYAEQLKNFMRSKKINSKDTLILFSGSGNSKNMLEVIKYVKKYSVYTCCVSGRGGGIAKTIADLSVLIPGKSKFPGQTDENDNNFHIEDCQVSISHMITGLLKDYLKN